MTIYDILLYIEDNLKTDIRLVDIANKAGYSPRHIYDILEEYTQKPIMSYVRERKMLVASKELLQGRRLFDVALDYGFETQAGFYKAFDSIIGCSPSVYKHHKMREIELQNISNLNNIIKGVNFMENLAIREVVQSDAKNLWENIYSRNTPSEVEERIAGNILEMKAGNKVHLVAVIDENIVGSMLLVMEKHPLFSHRCSINDAVVNPAFQKMGIARKLFNQCICRAKKWGINLITVTCRSGETELFYKKLGFEECGRIPNGIVETWGDKNIYDEVLFCRNI